MKVLEKILKKKYYEELINKVYTEEEINIKLLKHLKENGMDLELIINNNKNKIKKNIELIFKLFFEYININVNKIKTKDLKNINHIFEKDCDLYIKDSLINLIYEISSKNKYKNEIPIKLLINLSREIVKLSNLSSDNNIDNSTLFFNMESVLLTNDKKINIIIDILYNFLIKKRDNIINKIDDSIFFNLCFYINSQKVNNKNKDKIIKILKDNKTELKGNIKDIFEIVNKTKKLEESCSDNDIIINMIDIEKK